MTQIGGQNPSMPRAPRTGDAPATTTPSTTSGTAPTATASSETQGPPLTPTTTGHPTGDTFTSGGPGISSTARGPTEQKMDAALSAFQTRLEETLHHDALSLSRGQTPWREGMPLSDAQRDAMQGAAKDFVKDIPLGALAPGVMQDVEARLASRGIVVENLASKSLTEVGKVAGDIAGDKAKELADGLKNASPAAYYGLLGGAAVAVGAYGYAKGSDALEKIGIKPELKKGFFDDHLTARVHAAWEPGLKNVTFGGTVRGHVDVTPRWNVAAEANFDKNRFVDLRLDSVVKLSNHERFSVSAGVNEFGKLSSMSGRYDLVDSERGLTVSGGARYDFDQNRAGADVMVRYQPNQNLDFALSGQTDFRGNHQVGVGVRWRF